MEPPCYFLGDPENLKMTHTRHFLRGGICRINDRMLLYLDTCQGVAGPVLGVLYACKKYSFKASNKLIFQL